MRKSDLPTSTCNCEFTHKGLSLGSAPNHGMKSTPLYQLYKGMKSRCFSSKKPGDIKYYQAKGIGVCLQWTVSFLAFYSDMGDRPTPKHSLDRLDSNKGYCPHNCRWATAKEQAENKTNSVWDFQYVKLHFNGRTFMLGKVNGTELAERLISEVKYTITKDL